MFRPGTLEESLEGQDDRDKQPLPAGSRPVAYRVLSLSRLRSTGVA